MNAVTLVMMSLVVDVGVFYGNYSGGVYKTVSFKPSPEFTHVFSRLLKTTARPP